MKDKTKIYINLSKCTEEQQRHIFSLLPEPVKKGDYFIDDENHILHFNTVFAYPRWYVDFEYYNKKELSYTEFIKLFEGGEREEVLQVENNEWIKSIAISHQKQMSSTHPHAIIGTIEDAIIEALETFKSNQ